MSDFFHGVETRRTTTGPAPAPAIATALIALIGTAPVHHTDTAHINQPRLVSGASGAAAFAGPDLAGYTAPQAFTALLQEGGGQTVFVNVFDPAVHKTDIAAEAVTLAGDTATLANADITTATVQSSDQLTTYVAGTDYSLDQVTGVLTRIDGGAIAIDATLSVDYSVGNPGAVTAADIIGGVDGDNVRTGIEALRNAFSLFAQTPKILIAPGYSTDASVVAALAALAADLTAEAYIDAPVGSTFSQVLAARSDTSLNLNQGSDRIEYFWPHVQVADGQGGTRLEGQSARAAGLRARIDRERGYFHSKSGKRYRGILGLEVPLDATNSPASDINALNAAGITTVRTGLGGFVCHGNRASSFPASTAVETFTASRRAFDYVDEVIERISLDFLGEPLNDPTIQSIIASANAFIDAQISLGALVAGSRAFFDPDKNPAAQLASGRLILSRSYMSSVPTERITHEADIDVNLLNTLAA